MGLCIIIVYAIGRGVGYEDIQISPISDTIEEQPGQHFECAKVCFVLSVLVCAVGSVFDGTAKAADQDGGSVSDAGDGFLE